MFFESKTEFHKPKATEHLELIRKKKKTAIKDFVNESESDEATKQNSKTSKRIKKWVLITPQRGKDLEQDWYFRVKLRRENINKVQCVPLFKIKSFNSKLNSYYSLD